MHTKCFNLLQVIFSFFPFSLPFSNAFRGCPLSFYLLWVKPVNISGHFGFLPFFWVTMRCNELVVMCYEIEIQTCEVPKIPWGHSESLFSTFLLFFLLPNRVFNQNSLFIIYVLPFWLLLHLYFFASVLFFSIIKFFVLFPLLSFFFFFGRVFLYCWGWRTTDDFGWKHCVSWGYHNKISNERGKTEAGIV